MRKADYQTLARIVREQIDIANSYGALQKDNPIYQAACIEARKTAEAIALQCAGRLHVDKAEFLKACGID